MRASINISRNKVISEIDDRIYSSFIEHMGRAVYTGIYEPDHPTANQAGFRKDVLSLITPLNLSHIRYPGGNFVSGYRWEDGVGNRDQRPVRRDLGWMAIEPNAVGTNEFIDFCKSAGAEPMMAVNLGTRGAQEAVDLLEYCNIEGGTYLSNLRRSHGWINPHGIKLWCLGNEMDGPWQICAKTAEEYSRLACETAKMMKWMDPSVELVACGSSGRTMPTFGAWERTVLRHCGQYVDYLSLHQYYQNDDGDIATFLARSCEMDGFIKEVAEICRQYKSATGADHDIYLSFDEWNVWYHYRKDGTEPQKWIIGRPIEEEQYDFADALLVGGMLTTLINNADTVKIACLAQLVNVIAPIMTEPGGTAWVQTTYYPFVLTSRYGRGVALKPEVSCPTYACQISDRVPYLDCASILSKEQDGLTVILCNKNLEEECCCCLTLDGFSSASFAEQITLTAPSLHMTNTAQQQCVKEARKRIAATGSQLSVLLPPASWNMVRIVWNKEE